MNRSQPFTDVQPTNSNGVREAGGDSDDDRDTDHRQPAGNDQSPIQRLHDPVVGPQLHKVGADDGGQDADRADAKRQHQQRVAHRTGEEDPASSMVATMVTA